MTVAVAEAMPHSMLACGSDQVNRHQEQMRWESIADSGTKNGLWDWSKHFYDLQTSF